MISGESFTTQGTNAENLSLLMHSDVIYPDDFAYWLMSGFPWSICLNLGKKGEWNSV